MKPQLVIGLGNPLMGDDGVGCAVAERLAADPRLPETVEVICGGTDLLRYSAQIAGRSRVIVLDAIEDDGQPGHVAALSAAALDARQDHAHHLSAIQAIQLLEMTTPVSSLLLAISISSARAGLGLSPALAARLPAIVDRLLRELERSAEEARTRALTMRG